MKMLSFLAGELSNSAKYFSSFAPQVKMPIISMAHLGEDPQTLGSLGSIRTE
jgi:hypothetical protein